MGTRLLEFAILQFKGAYIVDLQLSLTVWQIENIVGHMLVWALDPETTALTRTRGGSCISTRIVNDDWQY